MRIRTIAAALSLALLTACGGGEEPLTGAQNAVELPPPPKPTSSADGSVDLAGSPMIEEIRKRGKLMVGLRSDDPRFAVREGPGEYGGFDVEIAKIVAVGIGLDPETQVSFRWLPPPLVPDAIAAENVDVQVGGFDPSTPEIAKVGPYAVTGDGAEHFLGIRPGDDAMGDELRRILDEAASSGAWQRAYDASLGAAGVPASPR